MSHLTAPAKVSKIFQEQFCDLLQEWVDQLVGGQLLEVESKVFEFTSHLYERLMTCAIQASASIFCEQQAAELVNVVERPGKLIIRTGLSISFPSLYQKRVEEGHQGSRHLLANHWGLIAGNSPTRYSLLSYATMIAPSYAMGKELLSKFGLSCCTTTLREVTDKMGIECGRQGEANLILEAKETLVGKRVVISSDGGRTRTRLPNSHFNKETAREGYTTPWREPKLFVIEVLDDEGRLSRYHLPIYGCRFEDGQHVELLRDYLSRLGIDQAKEVQLLADGAPWIWLQIPEMLRQLGVAENRLTQTLDYYHAVEHLNSLFENLPTRVGKKQAGKLQKRCKEWLWQGKIGHILRLWSMLYKRKPKAVNTQINYFIKHQHRMRYAHFRQEKLMCGSGVIESAIRRVINLRFKNTGTFWLAENVERLYFLRGAVLAKRWDLMITNLAKRYY